MPEMPNMERYGRPELPLLDDPRAYEAALQQNLEYAASFLSTADWKNHPKEATKTWDMMIASTQSVARLVLSDRRYAVGLQLTRECSSRNRITGTVDLYREYEVVDQYGDFMRSAFNGTITERNAIVAGTATSANASWQGHTVRDCIGAGAQPQYNFYQTFQASSPIVGSFGVFPLYVADPAHHGVLAVEATPTTVKINGVYRTTGNIDPTCPSFF
jgi:hypothetical protein